MTRTFCVDAEPEGELARIFDVVQTSQAAGAAAVRPATQPRTSTTSVAGSSPTPVGPSASSTAPGTVSGSISTKPPPSAIGHCYPRPWLRSSPSSPVSMFRARRRPCRGHLGGDEDGARPLTHFTKDIHGSLDQ